MVGHLSAISRGYFNLPLGKSGACSRGTVFGRWAASTQPNTMSIETPEQATQPDRAACNKHSFCKQRSQQHGDFHEPPHGVGVTSATLERLYNNTPLQSTVNMLTVSLIVNSVGEGGGE